MDRNGLGQVSRFSEKACEYEIFLATETRDYSLPRLGRGSDSQSVYRSVSRVPKSARPFPGRIWVHRCQDFWTTAPRGLSTA